MKRNNTVISCDDVLKYFCIIPRVLSIKQNVTTPQMPSDPSYYSSTLHVLY